MIKILDCSNSGERQEHRGGRGPVTNDVMRYLQTYASDYGCVFTGDVAKADIIITNDVFPTKLHSVKLPKLKRMDGVYFQNQFKVRNEPLNQSALLADHVIFISEFSRQSYDILYGQPLKSFSIALNQVDPSVYYANSSISKNERFTLISSATSWDREEKRLADIIRFAKISGEQIQLIGSMSDSVKASIPDNVLSLGYNTDNEKTCRQLNEASAFLNFSYKDAAPKTVLQGLCCGLPVFYANSGGLQELVGECGVGISDGDYKNRFEERCPMLDLDDVMEMWAVFKSSCRKLQELTSVRDNEDKFRVMLEQYFGQIKRLVYV